ncbi:unnamed protein product, partial [Effrenium voratum]
PLDSSEAGEWLRAVLVKDTASLDPLPAAQQEVPQNELESVCKPPEAVVGTVMVQHKKWRTVHLAFSWEPQLRWDTPKCRQCFKSAVSFAEASGILAKGELEPSDALLDLAAGIVESNVVLWISPERCGKREDELLQLNKNNRLRQTLAQNFACSGPCRGYASVKVSQLMKADQQLWLLASDEGLPSLKPAADGVKPLNPVVEKLRVDPRVT